jgi:peptidyl-prolyl cis-trans isomerase-like protein 2
VYCWEAVDELCLKPKHFRDLLTDEPFTKKTDLIHLQDPLNLSDKNLAEFDHVKHGRMAEEELEKAEKYAADPLSGINANAIAQDTQRALQALGSDEAAKAFEAGGGGRKAQAERALADAKAKEAAAKNKKTSPAAASKATTNNNNNTAINDPRLRGTPRDPYANVNFKPGTHTWNTDAPNSTDASARGRHKDKELSTAGKNIPPPYSATWIEGHTSTGAASKSFTSTAMPVATKNERTMVLQQLCPKKKGYLRLHTSLGDLNLELHCDLVPKTCENFMALAESGYYTGTKFHRSIKNFMVQGGDPTGSGKGGASVYGRTFNDEIVPQLLHDGRGVLAMANSGKNTNGSQFFILYKSAPHLNYKHTVFGKVVGGFDVLTLMEKIPTDDEDRPLQEIEITGATVFVNPYTELLEEEKEKKKKAEAEEKRKKNRGGTKSGGTAAQFVNGTEEDLGAWFSDPGASGATGGIRGGVGKYLKSSTLGAGVGATATAVGTGTGRDGAQPAAKKAKSAGAPLVNFDAW